MIKDTLSEIISNDPSCLLGLNKFDRSNYLYSIAPLNVNHLYPLNDAHIDNVYNYQKPLRVFGEWSNESNIFKCFNCFLDPNNQNSDANRDYIYSSNDWKIETNFSLAKEVNHNNIDTSKSDFTIMSLINVNGSNIVNIDNVEIQYEFIYQVETGTDGSGNPIYENRTRIETEMITISRSQIFNYTINGSTQNEISRSTAIKNKIDELNAAAKVQIFKQGYSSDYNKVFDVYFKMFSDTTGIFGRFYVTVYFEDDTKSQNVWRHYPEILEYNFSNEFLVDSWNLISIFIDSTNGLLRLFNFDNELSSIALITTDNQLAYPISNNQNDYKFNIGDTNSKKLKMKNIFIFNRILEIPEIRFLMRTIY